MNVIKIKIILLIVALIIILFIIMMSLYYFRPQYVDLQLLTFKKDPIININDGKTDFNSELHWWFIDSIPIDFNEIYLQKWGLNFDELGIDFDKNNIILSFSREIKEMKFNRAYWFPYHKIQTVKTKMSKNFEPNTIYVYIIPKYDVREDMRAYTETYLEK